MNNTATRQGCWPEQLAGSRDPGIRACEENVRKEPGREIEKREIRVRKGERRKIQNKGGGGMGDPAGPGISPLVGYKVL